MLGIAVTSDDLAETRFATSAVWELTASLSALTDESARGLHRPLVQRIPPESRKLVQRLLGLTVVPGWLPDSLAPRPPSHRLEPLQQIADLLDTDPAISARDLATLQERLPNGWMTGMSPKSFLEALVDLMSSYWTSCLSSVWERVDAIAQSDIAYRRQILSQQGLGATIDSLAGGVRYRQGMVSIESTRRFESSPDTGGGGLWLIPSVFRWRHPAVACGRSGVRAVSYPAMAAGTLWDDVDRRTSRGLAAVVGRSRFAILHELRSARSTTGLASRLDLSPGTVSVHLSALAASGLVSRVREGRLVMYSLTAAGRDLLRSETQVSC